jgi:hypothetical protein
VESRVSDLIGDLIFVAFYRDIYRNTLCPLVLPLHCSSLFSYSDADCLPAR